MPKDSIFSLHPQASNDFATEQDYRAQLTAHLRNPTQHPAPADSDAERLAVYQRLIRNNLHNFLDRCFTHARALMSESAWSDAKEAFVAHGNAHSPLFSDIPAQFLAHHQAQRLLSPQVLAVMDAECRELAAEIAPNSPPTRLTVAALQALETTAFDALNWRLSESASLAHYAFRVHQSKAEAGQCFSVIWRDESDRVQVLVASPADFQLLQQFTQSALSLNSIIDALREYLPNIEEKRAEFRKALRHWAQLGVLYTF